MIYRKKRLSVEQKNCPACSESIAQAALKCRFCSHLMIDPRWQDTARQYAAMSETERGHARAGMTSVQLTGFRDVWAAMEPMLTQQSAPANLALAAQADQPELASRRERSGTGIYLLVAVGLLFALVLAFWGFESSVSPTEKPSKGVSVAQEKPTADERMPEANEPVRAEKLPRIPSDVNYSIIDQQIIPGVRRALTIRLNRKVTEEQRRAIALNLKAQDPKNYKRTFMGYLLPGMKDGAGAWATTHFDPNLEVRILGLTLAKEQELSRPVRQEAGRTVKGVWLDRSPFVSGRITFLERDGKLYVERLFKDGSGSTDRLLEEQRKDGNRFFIEGGRRSDYFKIDRQGNLQMWDEEGLIASAESVR